MDKKLKVLITAGGTKVPLDAVRHVGNFSKGKFGLALARRFTMFGADVTLLGSHEMLLRVRMPDDTDHAMRTASYVYFDEFRDQLFRLVEEVRPDIVVMAAAVSDFLYPDAGNGKLHAIDGELFLRLVSAPKLIAELRERCGKNAFIVGCKLEIDVAEEVLIEKARTQLKECRLNLVIANDGDRIKGGRHPVIVITPEGGAVRFDGKRRETVQHLVDVIRRRQRVHWSRTEQVAEKSDIPLHHEAYRAAGALLEFTRRAKVFGGTEGNLSVRVSPEGGFLVTPRQVQKSSVYIDDLAHVVCDNETGVVSYCGPKKSSIDSAVQSVLYERWPHVDAFLHLHPDAGIFVPDAVTDRAYPCGTREEANEILLAMSARRASPFLVELVDHGYLLAFEKGGTERILREWDAAIAAYRVHLAEVGLPQCVATLDLRPIFASASVIGVHAVSTAPHDRGCVSVFLLPESRKHGHGEHIMDALDRRGSMVKAHDLCEVTDYYISHGWKVTKREDGFAYLLPPSKRDDLRSAATLCLIGEAQGQVLLGKRKTAEWNGVYALPGGSEEPEDRGDLRKTAWREARQELQVQFAGTAVFSHHEIGICVGTGKDGESAYRVTAHVVVLPELPPFGSSEEMDGLAYDLVRAPVDLPMARGTKRILREVHRELTANRIVR